METTPKGNNYFVLQITVRGSAAVWAAVMGTFAAAQILAVTEELPAVVVDSVASIPLQNA
jgi:hypothetical protein